MGGHDPPLTKRRLAQQRAQAEADTFQLRRQLRFLGVDAHQLGYTRNNSDAVIAHAGPETKY